MAEIAPLKGIIYNPDKAGDPATLVAPPYDVVSPEEQEKYHNLNPFNVMNIDLGVNLPEETDKWAWHERALYEFNRWLAEGALVRHEKPSFYFTETDYIDPNTGEKKTRNGFFCLMRLEEFGNESKIRPHERTFSAHTAERFHLMEKVQANLSPIFSVFPDEKRQALPILQAGRKGAPMFDFSDQMGYGHRLWAVWDKNIIRALQELLKEKTVYIADGHHRYQTSLNYRRHKAERGVSIGHKSPLNYLLVYLCAITDPGLSILPAHRLMNRTLKMPKGDMEQALNKYFQVKTFSFEGVEEKSARRAFLRCLKEEGLKETTLGLYTNLAKTYYLLKKRHMPNNSTSLSNWPDLLQKLDTVVLTSTLFQDVFGMTDDDLDDASRITYSSIANDAIERVNQGRVEMAALHNPTRIEQVREVAEAGLIMPRKSTYFFPKVVTGLVINPVNPFEEIETSF